MAVPVEPADPRKQILLEIHTRLQNVKQLPEQPGIKWSIGDLLDFISLKVDLCTGTVDHPGIGVSAEAINDLLYAVFV